jgi:rare lipoprotein A (peptidoglycan hydrolase)
MNFSFLRSYNQVISRVLWILALAVFTIISALPSEALAFESKVTPTHLSGAKVVTKSKNKLPIIIDESEADEKDTPVALTAQGVRTPHPPKALVSKAKVKTSSPTASELTGTPILTMQGQASFYSRAGCLGCNRLRIMANGQPLNDNALTMAIGADKKHLVGRTARVTNLATGKAVNVRITDTGGFHQAKYGHRVADLTLATKQAIGMAGGVGSVRVEVF